MHSGYYTHHNTFLASLAAAVKKHSHCAWTGVHSIVCMRSGACQGVLGCKIPPACVCSTAMSCLQSSRTSVELQEAQLATTQCNIMLIAAMSWPQSFRTSTRNRRAACILQLMKCAGLHTRSLFCALLCRPACRAPAPVPATAWQQPWAGPRCCSPSGRWQAAAAAAAAAGTAATRRSGATCRYGGRTRESMWCYERVWVMLSCFVISALYNHMLNSCSG